MISAAKGDPTATMAALKLAQILKQEVAAQEAKMPSLTSEERAQRVFDILAIARKEMRN